MIRREHKDPKGGLNAKGRAAYNKATGSKLKPGVKGDPNTPEKKRRKGSWAVRFYGRKGPLPPLKKPNGEPTRFALTAAAWGEPIPETESDARNIAAKGRQLLEEYREEKTANVHDTADIVDFEASVPGAGLDRETGQPLTLTTSTVEPDMPKRTHAHAATDGASPRKQTSRGRGRGSFMDRLEKTAAMKPSTRKSLYKTLEYGGLGTLGAIDAHEAYKAHKEGDTAGRNKALLGTAALGALIGATRLASH